jgi:hypothetical protein
VLSKDVVEGIRHVLDEQVSSQALLPSEVGVRLTEARKAADMAGAWADRRIGVGRVDR